MNLANVLDDLDELQAEIEPRQSAVLWYDLKEAKNVEIRKYRFPGGWMNRNGGRRGTVRIDLPETYPRTIPDVYVSAGLQYEGIRPHVMYHPARYGPDGWSKYCIHDVDWNGSEHDLAKLFQILEVSLADPKSKNPLLE